MNLPFQFFVALPPISNKISPYFFLVHVWKPDLEKSWLASFSFYPCISEWEGSGWFPTAVNGGGFFVAAVERWVRCRSIDDEKK